MTDSRGPGRLPFGHAAFRLLLVGLVVTLIGAALIAIVLHRADELAVGRVVWDAVKHWTLPW